MQRFLRFEVQTIFWSVLAGTIFLTGSQVYAIPVGDAFNTNQAEIEPAAGFHPRNETPSTRHPSLTPQLNSEINEPHPIPDYLLRFTENGRLPQQYTDLLKQVPVDRVQSMVFNQQAFDQIRRIGVSGFDNKTFFPNRDESAGTILAKHISQELEMVQAYRVIPPPKMIDARMKIISSPNLKSLPQEQPSAVSQDAVSGLPYSSEKIDAVMIGAVSKYLDTYSDNHGIRKESLSSGLEFTTFLVSTKTGDVVWGARFVGNQEIGLRSLFKSEPIWMSREKLSRGIMKDVLKSFYKTRSVQK